MAFFQFSSFTDAFFQSPVGTLDCVVARGRGDLGRGSGARQFHFPKFVVVLLRFLQVF
jgi:hypothetical protein